MAFDLFDFLRGGTELLSMVGGIQNLFQSSELARDQAIARQDLIDSGLLEFTLGADLERFQGLQDRTNPFLSFLDQQVIPNILGASNQVNDALSALQGQTQSLRGQIPTLQGLEQPSAPQTQQPVNQAAFTPERTSVQQAFNQRQANQASQAVQPGGQQLSGATPTEPAPPRLTAAQQRIQDRQAGIQGRIDRLQSGDAPLTLFGDADFTGRRRSRAQDLSNFAVSPLTPGLDAVLNANQDQLGMRPGQEQARIDISPNDLARLFGLENGFGGSKAATPAPGVRRTPIQPPQPFVGSFQQGTGFVPKTGLAQVHKGEAIIPAKQNPNALSSTAQGFNPGPIPGAFQPPQISTPAPAPAPVPGTISVQGPAPGFVPSAPGPIPGAPQTLEEAVAMANSSGTQLTPEMTAQLATATGGGGGATTGGGAQTGGEVADPFGQGATSFDLATEAGINQLLAFLEQGGPLGPEIQGILGQQVRDTAELQRQASDRAIREQFGARNFGDSAAQDFQRLQNQLSSDRSITEGLNQIGIQAGIANFAGLQGVAESLIGGGVQVGQLDLATQIAEIEAGLGERSIALQERLGVSEIDFRNREIALSEILGLGGLGLAENQQEFQQILDTQQQQFAESFSLSEIEITRMVAEGELSLGRQTLNLQALQGNRALDIEEMLGVNDASIRLQQVGVQRRELELEQQRLRQLDAQFQSELGFSYEQLTQLITQQDREFAQSINMDQFQATLFAAQNTMAANQIVLDFLASGEEITAAAAFALANTIASTAIQGGLGNFDIEAFTASLQGITPLPSDPRFPSGATDPGQR